MKDKFVIGIAGGSGSGKTTLAMSIVEAIGSHRVSFLQQDTYYRNQSHLPPETRNWLNFDRPDAFDNDLFYRHIHSILQDMEAHVPIYDFTTHGRTGQTKTVYAKEVLLLEGVLLFVDKNIRDLIDLKAFVDTDSDLRFIRRLQRDVAERGRSMDSVIVQYLSTVKLMHEEFVAPTKQYADMVVNGNGDLRDTVEAILDAISGGIK